MIELFSPFDLVLPGLRTREALNDEIMYSLNSLHAAQWNAVYNRMARLTCCDTLADLAGWLDMDPAQARRVAREERLPLEWLKRLCFKGRLNPVWILIGRPPEHLPYRPPARDSAWGRELEDIVTEVAAGLEYTTHTLPGFFGVAAMRENPREELDALRETFDARRPEWAKAFCMAEHWRGEGRERARTRRVFLQWSPHTRDCLPELRKAAGRFEPTAFLAAAPGEYARRKVYGTGDGAGSVGYLADSEYEHPGWKVRKVWICSGTDLDLEWDAAGFAPRHPAMST